MPSNIPANGLQRLAPAKINLWLHITGQRADDYHELDSLVTFADGGDDQRVRDVVRVFPDDDLSLEITGPEAPAFAGADLADNLVMQAARTLAHKFDVTTGARLVLEKNLPVASGIGGGSADAAATLRALVFFWGLTPSADDLAALALGLGADVPVCLQDRTLRMTGIGERLHEVSPLPLCHMVLVNPRTPLSTPDVFRRLHGPGWKPGAPAAPLPLDMDFLTFVTELKMRRNDLQGPAVELQPAIADVLDLLAKQTGCRLARMSGSGATCFALFQSAEDARAAATAIETTQPDWWLGRARFGEDMSSLEQAYTG